MRASTRRMLSFLVSFVLLVGAMAVYGFLIVPSYEQIQRSRAEIDSRRTALEEQRRVVTRIQDLLKRFEGSENIEETISLSLPNEPFISQVLGHIEGIAAGSNLALSSMQTELLPFQASVGAPNYIRNLGAVGVKLNVAGTYEDFKRFVDQIQNNVRIMDVRDIVIQTNTTNRTAPTQTFTVSLLAYYQDASSLRANKSVR